ncbi:ABC transporter substrate-binding protein [Catenovulum maritimum]|uniref:Periplasmic binding protein domain-containing protein n=1 Tax=Catenovulum maritimum TaxID=1513271 RepID=A0A0J8GYZ4_9ALTE|nr:ABC transporter substrate-binding protein [Catenovulum maritimum]KMT65963.1 hypothetical protein XM47_05770 [Catenovulum maritimum]
MSYLRFSLLIFLFFSPLSFAKTAPIPVTVVFPNKPDYAYFKSMHNLMLVAASQLNIKLSVVYSHNNRHYVLQKIHEEFTSSQQPKYLILPPMHNVLEPALKLAQKHKTQVITINSKPPEQEQAKLIGPRLIYPNWIASISSPDVQVGYQLANDLIQAAKTKLKENEKVRVLALLGRKNNTASDERGLGLKQALQEYSNTTELVGWHHVGWSKKLSRPKLHKLAKELPKFDILWVPGDSIADAAISIFSQYNLIAGKDYILGGIDWSNNGLEAVTSGQQIINYGGQYLDGVRALILISDYDKGIDILQHGSAELITPFVRIDKTNIRDYLNFINEKKWLKINFVNFTSANNPANKYQFTMLDLLKMQKAQQ